MQAATKRLVAFAAIIGAALLLLIGLWTYNNHRHAPVPVIEADSRPLRERPTNPGGLQVEDANDAFQTGDKAAGQTVAPPPESPATRALQAQEQAAVAAGTNGAGTTANQMTVRAELQPLPTLRPHIGVTDSKPSSATAPAAASRSQMASAQPAPFIAQGATPAPAPATARPRVAASQPTVASAALVQFAAVKTEADALAEWQRLSHKYPDLLGGHRPVISKTENAGNVYWRVRTGGFADSGRASAFCEQVKAKGGGCSVARL